MTGLANTVKENDFFLTKFYHNKPLKDISPAYTAIIEKRNMKFKEARLREIKNIYQRMLSLLYSDKVTTAHNSTPNKLGNGFSTKNIGDDLQGAAQGILLSQGARKSLYKRENDTSKVMPKYIPRLPVFKPLSKPQIKAVPYFKGNLSQYSELGNQLKGKKILHANKERLTRDEPPHLALKNTNPFFWADIIEATGAEANIAYSMGDSTLALEQKDLIKNPVFSLPNPYKLASEKIFKLSGWQGVTALTSQQLNALPSPHQPESLAHLTQREVSVRSATPKVGRAEGGRPGDEDSEPVKKKKKTGFKYRNKRICKIVKKKINCWVYRFLSKI